MAVATNSTPPNRTAHQDTDLKLPFVRAVTEQRCARIALKTGVQFIDLVGARIPGSAAGSLDPE
jgi:hypothetical protein